MENYKKKLKNRSIFAGIYIFATILLNVLATIFNNQSHATGFALGASTGIGAIMIAIIIKYRGALKNEEKLKQLYIAEQDERRIFINSKIGGTGIVIAIMLLGLATIIANYYNMTVFITLLATVFFLSILKGTLKAYYNKKF